MIARNKKLFTPSNSANDDPSLPINRARILEQRIQSHSILISQSSIINTKLFWVVLRKFLKAYDGEVNLVFDENLISNEYVVKLCLDYGVKKGKKIVKKELIVSLKGELYFVKFIINHEEDDYEPRVILGRSFLRLSHGVVDFSNGVITIYPEPNPFEDDYEKTRKSSDDWDQLLDFNFDDVPNWGTFNSRGSRERGIAVRISQKFALLEEERPVIETMAYNDKYKKILDETWKYKMELDGKAMKEEEDAVKRIKGEALKAKDDLGAFIFPISFFFFSSIAVQTSGSGISIPLTVATTFPGSGNLYYQWELYLGSGNALCILFPTILP
uniref:Uncharacterized protein n=1 Tax=Tanacetum cinerariifolium TaxID=118510 RepID=A0A6L2K5X1_TANCI|nr:hypothetical protein [Tanacetum cinerariifolium]